MKECKGNYGTTEQKEQFLKLLEENKGDSTELINVLHKTQDIYGFLPEHLVYKIAETLNVSISEVYGVITFYTQFSLTPKAKYTVDICMGTACYVLGAEEVLNRFADRLKLKPGELSADGKWLISSCRCIGCCGLAPAIKINDKIYGKVNVQDVDKILDEYKDA